MIKYVGDGAYFHGIPARDLTDAEFAALPAATQQVLLNSGIYVQEPEAETAVEAAAPTTRRRRAVEPETSETPAAG